MKRDKVVPFRTISNREIQTATLDLRSFLEITGQGGGEGSKCGRPTVAGAKVERGRRSGVKREKKKKIEKKSSIGLCASNKEADFLPVYMKRGTRIFA